MDSKFKRWEFKDGDLKDLTTSKARDLIIQCFFDAQKETFLRAKQDLGKQTGDSELYNSVKASVKLTFKEVGADFDNPSKDDLGSVVQTLARKASSWGTPEDIIKHHKDQIMRILGALN
jgi:hypothetical protein